jgi:hypothetical protein
VLRLPPGPRPLLLASVPPAGWLLVIALSSAGCARSPTIRAAEQGRFEGLREALSARVAQGTLSASEAEGFARAVTRGEVTRAAGNEGVERVHELSGCAREVDGVLGDRASTRDAVGAAAALVLVEAGVNSPGRYAKWAHAAPDDREAAWRPLGARSLTSGDDGPLRRRLIADPDQEVRRNALHASLTAGDPEDTEAVLEAARVDPHPAAQAEAIRAAGVLGGQRVVIALRDLWPRADASVREAIVEAWATERSFKSGGQHELTWVVETQRGVPATVAASKLVRRHDGGNPQTPGDGGAAVDAAAGALERAIADGPTADRQRAIDLAPFSIPAIRTALAKAESDADEVVATAAMARRLFEPADQGGAPARSADREALVTKLLSFASGTGAGATLARATLARAKVAGVIPLLEREGSAKDAATRIEAGKSLAAAGDLGRAAVVAADLEPRVRVAVACAILHPAAAR